MCGKAGRQPRCAAGMMSSSSCAAGAALAPDIYEVLGGRGAAGPLQHGGAARLHVRTRLAVHHVLCHQADAVSCLRLPACSQMAACARVFLFPFGQTLLPSARISGIWGGLGVEAAGGWRLLNTFKTGREPPACCTSGCSMPSCAGRHRFTTPKPSVTSWCAGVRACEMRKFMQLWATVVATVGCQAA